MLFVHALECKNEKCNYFKEAWQTIDANPLLFCFTSSQPNIYTHAWLVPLISLVHDCVEISL